MYSVMLKMKCIIADAFQLNILLFVTCANILSFNHFNRSFIYDKQLHSGLSYLPSSVSQQFSL